MKTLSEKADDVLQETLRIAFTVPLERAIKVEERLTQIWLISPTPSSARAMIRAQQATDKLARSEARMRMHLERAHVDKGRR
jgi:hypothetical protein